MKTNKRHLMWIGIVFIITGLTSFSNHPAWGNIVSGTGLLILIVFLVLPNTRSTR